MDELEYYGSRWIRIEYLWGCLLYHSVYDLKADGDCGSFVVSYNTEKFEVENVEISCATRDGYLFEEGLTEDGYWDGLNLLE